MRDDSSEMCRELVARHLFTMRLEAEGEWYRYHHLFQAFLRAPGERSSARSGARLHRRAASAWIEAGEPGQAVEHLLAAGDYARAADVIDSLADEMLLTPQSALLARWIERVPEQEHHGRPALVLARAALTFQQGDYAGAFALLEPAIDDFIAQGNHERAAAAFFLLIYAQLSGGTPQSERDRRRLPAAAADRGGGQLAARVHGAHGGGARLRHPLCGGGRVARARAAPQGAGPRSARPRLSRVDPGALHRPPARALTVRPGDHGVGHRPLRGQRALRRAQLPDRRSWSTARSCSIISAGSTRRSPRRDGSWRPRGGGAIREA